MALLNGQNVCDTVAFRISNRLAANGTGAGSIIECANLALGLISSAASWTWDQTVPLVSITADISAPIVGADPGKEIMFFNPNGTRIERTRASDFYSASQGYLNTQATSAYNTFFLVVDSGGSTYDPVVRFYPQRSYTGTLSAVVHLVPPVLVYGVSPTVRWTVKAMDQLLIDLTEAYVKRILGMAGWDILWSDCIKRISEFKTTYSSQRENTGPADETKEAEQEKMTGRD
jgi:hypothetical protein